MTRVDGGHAADVDEAVERVLARLAAHTGFGLTEMGARHDPTYRMPQAGRAKARGRAVFGTGAILSVVSTAPVLVAAPIDLLPAAESRPRRSPSADSGDPTPSFGRLDGVARTRVGYCGGTTAEPTYHRLGDHTEAFEVDFDPEVVSYEELLAQFWSSRDHSREAFSRQYRAAVFTQDDAQHELAQRAAEAWARERGLSVTTAVERLDRFYLAEDYHQKYRLRGERGLCEELVDRYGSDEAMVNATASARINGLLGSYLGEGELEALLPLLALSPRGAERLRARVHR